MIVLDGEAEKKEENGEPQNPDKYAHGQDYRRARDKKEGGFRRLFQTFAKLSAYSRISTRSRNSFPALK